MVLWQKMSTSEHKLGLRHNHLFWTYLLCCFPLHSNFEIKWFSTAPDFLLVASPCLEIFEQSYQKHGFLYLCWGMLMFWCYTNTHGLPKDQLISMCLHRPFFFIPNILWMTSTFPFPFPGFTLDIIPGYFIAHTKAKMIKK